MTKFKILMISGYPPWHPKVGGGDIIAYKFSEKLSQMGHSITYLAVADESFRREVVWGDFRYVSEGEDFSSISLSNDFDIMHIHNVIGLKFNTYRKLRKNKKSVIGLYAPLAHRFPRSSCEIFYRYLCKDADLVISLSEFSKQNISSAYGINPSKIEVMYAGIDDSFLEINKSSVNNNTLSKEDYQNKMEKTIRLLFSGRLDRKQQKGVDILLKAMPLILKEHKVILLNIIGDGVRLDHYKTQAKQLGIEKSVNFRGFLPYDAMPAEYSVADLFILPSRRESFGLVLAEAMASSLPVISTTAGAIPEVVENGVTGILVPPEDPEKLANAVIHLLDDSEKMKLMGLMGKERVEKYFTWNKVVIRAIDCYNLILTEAQ
jgi:glycosyltransferase involved in cell wall biosynthesis